MKLIREYLSIIDAEKFCTRLENKGIATFLSSKRSHAIPLSLGGADKVGVWVILEEQYEDAFQLAHNKKHNVGKPLSQEQITDLKRQIRTTGLNQLFKISMIVFSVAILIISTLIWISW